MEDFFNGVVIFLEEYYVYVVGAGLIIILMLIGLLASSRKARKASKDEEPMANINDVNTGSINDVANNLQSDIMQPIDVVTFPEENSTVTNNEPIVSGLTDTVPTAPTDIIAFEPIAQPEVTATQTVAPSVVPVSSMPDIATPIVNEVITNDAVTVKPIVEETSALEEIKPVDEERFDKTEIIDFSELEPLQSTEVKPNEFSSFVVDKSQYSDDDSILNGETSSTEEPKI